VTFTEVVLDGCCCEGGGARGLVQAGCYVVGVDTDASCREGYLRAVGDCGEFVHADIRDVLADISFMTRFTSASLHPPCQFYSWMSQCRPGLAAGYPDLIGPVRELAQAWAGRAGGVFVIENVEGARSWLRNPVTMCMHMFGRPGYRHRLLEAGGGLTLYPPVPPPAGQPFDEGNARIDRRCGWPHPVPAAKAGHWEPGKFVSVAGHERKEQVFSVMEIGWMSSRDKVKEAIPPYLGSWIAGQVASWRAGQEAA